MITDADVDIGAVVITDADVDIGAVVVDVEASEDELIEDPVAGGNESSNYAADVAEMDVRAVAVEIGAVELGKKPRGWMLRRGRWGQMAPWFCCFSAL